MKPTLKALLVILGLYIPALLLHTWAAGPMFSITDYFLGYGINLVLAAVILFSLLNVPARYKTSLGFFFMFGSFLKFIIYFVAFRPIFGSDGTVSKAEFLLFFIPYAVCLIVETTVLIAKLKAEDKAL